MIFSAPFAARPAARRACLARCKRCARNAKLSHQVAASSPFWAPKLFGGRRLLRPIKWRRRLVLVVSARRRRRRRQQLNLHGSLDFARRSAGREPSKSRGLDSANQTGACAQLPPRRRRRSRRRCLFGEAAKWSYYANYGLLAAPVCARGGHYYWGTRTSDYNWRRLLQAIRRALPLRRQQSAFGSVARRKWRSSGHLAALMNMAPHNNQRRRSCSA